MVIYVVGFCIVIRLFGFLLELCLFFLFCSRIRPQCYGSVFAPCCFGFVVWLLRFPLHVASVFPLSYIVFLINLFRASHQVSSYFQAGSFILCIKLPHVSHNSALLCSSPRLDLFNTPFWASHPFAVGL